MVLYHTLCVLLPCILCETILLWKRRGDHKSPLHRKKALLCHLAGVLFSFLIALRFISFDHAFNSGESEKISVEYMTIPHPDEASLSFEKDWVMEHAALFPEGKVESAAENPELIHFMFMLGNGDTGSESKSMLTEEETSGEIPCLFQWDKRWGFYDYGESNVGFSGCGPTCLAMVLAAYIGDPNLTPGFLSNYAMENGYYESGTGTRWAFMTEVAESCGVTAKQLRPSQILDELSAGHPVIVIVGKGHFTEAGHFILLAGIEDGKIRVHDPNSLTNSEILWDFEVFQDEIKAGWGYCNG